MGFRMWLTLWVGIGVSVSLITTDIYLPSMPDMAFYFAVDEDIIQMTITLGYLGMVPAGILSGGLSDVFGRRPLILFGLLLVAVGGVLCVLTQTVSILFFGRLIQGLGTGTLCVVGMALVHDLYPKEEGASALSFLGAIFCIAPIFAPILGGMIHISLGWQANFLLIVFITFMVGSMIFHRRKKPLSENRSQRQPLHLALASYPKIIKDRKFMELMMLTPFLCSAELCYLTVLPFFFITTLGMTPAAFGLIIFPLPLAYCFGCLTVTRFLNRYSRIRIVFWGLLLALTGSAFSVLASFLTPMSAFPIIIGLSIHAIGMAWVFPSALSLALESYEDNKGAATAVRSMLINSAALFGSIVGSFLSSSTFFSTGLYVFLTSAIALLLFFKGKSSLEE